MSPLIVSEIARIHAQELADEAARHRRIARSKAAREPHTRRRWRARKVTGARFDA